MAVANCFSYEGAIKEIRGCLSKEIEAIERLVRKLVQVGSKTLSKMDVDMIKKLVNDAYKESHQACDIASGYVKKIQSVCERLTEEKGRLQKELQERKEELNSLQHQLNTIETEKEMNEKHLQEAESSLQEAEEALERLKDQEKAMETGRNVGIGLLFIPFIGPFLGAATIIGCEVSKSQAVSAQKAADDQVRSQRENVSRCISDLRDCASNIEMKKNEITQIEEKIQALDDEFTNQQELLEKYSETDHKLKNGMTILNELAGKMEVLKMRSEKFSYLDVVITVVGDIVLHISRLPNRECGKLLCQDLFAIQKLKNQVQYLKAIDSADSEYSEFY